MTTDIGADWAAWQESWDRQQEWYMPDREERFRVMLDMVEALVGPEPRVLDLACGTGSITARLFERFPKAVSTGVDLDPALLTIAEGTFRGTTGSVSSRPTSRIPTGRRSCRTTRTTPCSRPPPFTGCTGSPSRFCTVRSRDSSVTVGCS